MNGAIPLILLHAPWRDVLRVDFVRYMTSHLHLYSLFLILCFFFLLLLLPLLLLPSPVALPNKQSSNSLTLLPSSVTLCAQ